MGIMNLVAQRNVVYLDRGREDGIRPGDRMDVVRTGGNLPKRTVGELRILSMDDKTATALITRSTARILKGDRFIVKSHDPEAMPISQSPLQSLSDSPAQNVSPATAPSSRPLQAPNAAADTH